MTPTISIIIPTYNSGRFLPQALESIFSQNYDDYEVIVVDDGSMDDTAACLQPYTSRIHILHQANAGSAAARNTGLSAARGDYVVFLDADDLLLPGKLREQAAFLAVRPSLGYVHSGWHLMDEQGQMVGTITPWQEVPQLTLEAWLQFKPIKLGAMMFRRLWLDSVGGLDPSLRQAHDIDLLLRLSLAGCQGEWQYKPTLCYRQYPTSTMRRNAIVQAQSLMAVLAKFFACPNVPETIQAQRPQTYYYSTLWLAWHLWRCGDLEGTLPYLCHRLAASPFQNEPDSQACTVLDWFYHFIRWQERDYRDPALLPQMYPFFQQASGLAGGDWCTAERLLTWWLGRRPSSHFAKPSAAWPLFRLALQAEDNDKRPTAEVHLNWWLEIWLSFQRGDYEAAETALAAWAGLDDEQVRQLIQWSITVQPEQVTTTFITQVWHTARACGYFLGEADDGLLHAPDTAVPQPAVSVIIPTYNNATYLPQTIESVLAQTLADYEIVVIDDGSVDETVDVLRPYHHQIRYFCQQNQGVSAARNHGLRLAKGEFVLFLDGDDLLLPDKLAAQVACLQSEPALGAVHSGWRLVNQDGQPVGEVEPWHNTPGLTLLDWLMWKPVFLGAMLFRKSWLEQSAGFNTQLRQAEDTDLILRLALAGCTMTWLQRPTVCYRQHSENTMHNGLRQAEDMCRVLDSFFAEPTLPEEARQTEALVRYYTLLWLVWRLYRTGYEAAIPTYLQKVVPVTPETHPLRIIQKWLSGLVGFAQAARLDVQVLRAFWPHFQAVLAVDSQTWPLYEEILERWLQARPDEELLLNPADDWVALADFACQIEKDGRIPSAHLWLCWWLDIWQHYLADDRPQARENLPQFRHLPGEGVVALTQASMVRRPNQITLPQIEEVWQDVTAAGLVRPSDALDKTALYLTYFGQAALGRHWRLAGSGLWCALKQGVRSPARRSWADFGQMGLRYYRSGRLHLAPKVTPSEPPSATAAWLKGKIAYGLLLALLLLVMLLNLQWISQDTRPQPFMDPYPFYTLKFADDLREKGMAHLFQLMGEASVNGRPPLYQLLTVPAILFIERSVDAMLVVNVVSVMVLGLAVFEMGKLGKNNLAGLLAAFIVVTYPPIVNLAKMARPHAAIPTVTAVCFWLLFALVGKRSAKLAWLFGLSLAAAFWIHPNLFYILPLPTLLFSLYMIFFQTAPKRPQTLKQLPAWFKTKLTDSFVLKGLLPAGLIALGLTAVWYLPHHHELLFLAEGSAADWRTVRYGFENVPPTFWWYAQTMPGAISYFFTLLLAGSLLSALLRRRFYSLLIALTFLLVYAGLGLRQGTFAWMNGAAMLPLAAVLSAIFCVDLLDFALQHSQSVLTQHKRLAPFLNAKSISALSIGIIIFFMAFNFFVVNWGIPHSARPIAQSLGMPLDSACGWRMVVAFCPDQARQEDWQMDEILQRLHKERECQTVGCSLVVVTESAGAISQPALAYQHLQNIPDTPLLIVPIQDDGLMNLNWLTGDYLFYIPQLANHEYATAVTHLLQNYPANLEPKYEEVAQYALPRNWTAVLLKRTQPITHPEAVQLIEALDIASSEKAKLLEAVSEEFK
jgi:glycosyltransferase involved in cell wall biosynthesis